MANSFNDPSVIEEKLKELGQQYNEALRAGEKFSVLKEISGRINELMDQLPDDHVSRLNGDGWHEHTNGQDDKTS